MKKTTVSSTWSLVSVGIAILIPTGLGAVLCAIPHRPYGLDAPIQTVDTLAPRQRRRRIHLTRTSALTPKLLLRSLVLGIGDLEQHGTPTLTKKQANKMVAVLRPLLQKSSLSHAEAKLIYQQLNGLLNAQQKSELNRLSKTYPHPVVHEHRGMPGLTTAQIRPDLQNIDDLLAKLEKTRVFIASVNPFYPPDSYQELQELSASKREKIKENYQQHCLVLDKIAKKADS